MKEAKETGISLLRFTAYTGENVMILSYKKKRLADFLYLSGKNAFMYLYPEPAPELIRTKLASSDFNMEWVHRVPNKENDPIQLYGSALRLRSFLSKILRDLADYGEPGMPWPDFVSIDNDHIADLILFTNYDNVLSLSAGGTYVAMQGESDYYYVGEKMDFTLVRELREEFFLSDVSIGEELKLDNPFRNNNPWGVKP